MIRVRVSPAFSEVAELDGYRADAAEELTLQAVLAEFLRRHPVLAPSIVDDAGALRRDIALLIDSAAVTDRAGLSDVVKPDSTVDVMRSLGPGWSMAWSSDWREARAIVTARHAPSGSGTGSKLNRSTHLRGVAALPESHSLCGGQSTRRSM